MTTEQFIQKAIEGGWRLRYYKQEHPLVVHKATNDWTEIFIETTRRDGKPFYQVARERIEYVLLDPLAWQAVGKVEGWEYKLNGGTQVRIEATDPKEREKIAKEWSIKPDWLIYWHRMIDALAEGKSIEEFLATL